MHHQPVDVIPLERHDSAQCHQPEHTVAVEADEIIHVVVAAIRIAGKGARKHYHDEEEAPEVRLRSFVAEYQFQFQTHVFAHDAVTLEKRIVADVFHLVVFRARQFPVNQFALHPAVHSRQSDSHGKRAEKCQRIPFDVSFAQIHVKPRCPLRFG